jgi:hypothetical protein
MGQSFDEACKAYDAALVKRRAELDRRAAIELFVGMGALMVVFIVLAGVAAWAFDEGAEWKHFEDAHHCRKVGETQTRFTAGHYVQGTEGYACDDGVTYWRNR